MAIILFSAADVSPPFLTWTTQLHFPPWAVRFQTDPRSALKGMSQEQARRNSERWEEGVWAAVHPLTSRACLCKVSPEKSGALNISFWPQYSFKKLQFP